MTGSAPDKRGMTVVAASLLLAALGLGLANAAAKGAPAHVGMPSGIRSDRPVGVTFATPACDATVSPARQALPASGASVPELQDEADHETVTPRIRDDDRAPTDDPAAGVSGNIPGDTIASACVAREGFSA